MGEKEIEVEGQRERVNEKGEGGGRESERGREGDKRGWKK